MKIKMIFFGLLFEQCLFGMQVKPDVSLLFRLIEFHKPTQSSGDLRPNLDKFKSPDRVLVAQVRSSDSPMRYYLLQKKDDVQAVVDCIGSCGKSYAKWLGCNLAKEEAVVLQHRAGSATPILSIVTDEETADEIAID